MANGGQARSLEARAGALPLPLPLLPRSPLVEPAPMLGAELLVAGAGLAVRVDDHGGAGFVAEGRAVAGQQDSRTADYL